MPKKQKLESEEKVVLVRRCTAGEIGLAEAGGEADVDSAAVHRWIARYKAKGADVSLPRKRNRTYASELKLQVVEEYLSGTRSVLRLYKKHKISDQRMVSRWIKKYHAHEGFQSVKHSAEGGYMKQGQDTAQKARIQIAGDCLALGKNYGEIALKYWVGYQQMRNWALRYEQLGETGLEDRRCKRKKDQEPRTESEKAQIEIERLKHQLHLAELERVLLKNWTKSRGGMPATSKAGAPLWGNQGLLPGKQ